MDLNEFLIEFSIEFSLVNIIDRLEAIEIRQRVGFSVRKPIKFKKSCPTKMHSACPNSDRANFKD